jgi:hypothetical protein
MEPSYWSLPKSSYPTLWERFRLRFCPGYVILEGGYVIFYKILNGKVFVTGEEKIRDD